MASFSLPYFANAEILPAALPTVDDIVSAQEILSSTTGCKVVGVDSHFVVKYGVQVDPLEGQTMLYLAQSSLIPIPRVYAIFKTPGKSTNYTTYIVMKRIEGSILESAWPQMDDVSKKAVTSQLRSILEEMRKLPSPGGYCSVDHQALPDLLFWTPDPAKPFARPFDTEAELHNAIIRKYISYGRSKHKADQYLRVFACIYRGHEPTFSHGDFQRKNILVRNPSALADGMRPELVIVDWEIAGWYPSYWEYTRAMFACC